MRPPSAAYPPRTLGNLSPRTLVSPPRTPRTRVGFSPHLPGHTAPTFRPRHLDGQPSPQPSRRNPEPLGGNTTSPRLPPPAPESPTSRSQPRHQRPRLPPPSADPADPPHRRLLHAPQRSHAHYRPLAGKSPAQPHPPARPAHTAQPRPHHPPSGPSPRTPPPTEPDPDHHQLARHKLPTELHRIMKRHHRLQAIHPETLITGTIISLIHPRRNRYPDPTNSPTRTGTETPNAPDSAASPASGHTASPENGSPKNNPSEPSPPNNPTEPSHSV